MKKHHNFDRFDVSSKNRITKFLVMMVLLASVSMFLFVSCKKKEAVRPAGYYKLDIENIKKDGVKSIENLYLMPNSKDYLLNFKPGITSSLEQNQNFLEELKGTLNFDVNDEFIKYLERKHEFDKSAIFSDVP